MLCSLKDSSQQQELKILQTRGTLGAAAKGEARGSALPQRSHGEKPSLRPARGAEVWQRLQKGARTRVRLLLSPARGAGRGHCLAPLLPVPAAFCLLASGFSGARVNGRVWRDPVSLKGSSCSGLGEEAVQMKMPPPRPLAQPPLLPVLRRAGAAHRSASARALG